MKLYCQSIQINPANTVTSFIPKTQIFHIFGHAVLSARLTSYCTAFLYTLSSLKNHLLTLVSHPFSQTLHWRNSGPSSAATQIQIHVSLHFLNLELYSQFHVRHFRRPCFVLYGQWQQCTIVISIADHFSAFVHFLEIGGVVQRKLKNQLQVLCRAY